MKLTKSMLVLAFQQILVCSLLFQQCFLLETRTHDKMLNKSQNNMKTNSNLKVKNSVQSKSTNRDYFDLVHAESKFLLIF